MLIFDHENWRLYHRSWCIATVLSTIAALIWYVAYGFGSGSWNWPSGGSPPGFTYGVIGGGIIVFEMLLWPRKSLRRLRLGRTMWWMKAHLWLGLLSLPLLLLHGGFHFNLAASTLAAVLMWLLVLVVLSGVFGLVVQNLIPRLMLEKVPAETIYSQIGHVLRQYQEDAERLIAITCGESAGGADGDLGARSKFVSDSHAIVSMETVRQVGRVQGKVVKAGIKAHFVPDSEALLGFYENQVGPFLLAKSGANLPLGSPRRSESLFRTIKMQINPEAHPILDYLAELCDQRRQFDLQSRLHGWLHTWVGVHVALSVALLLLMFVHIYFALKYV